MMNQDDIAGRVFLSSEDTILTIKKACGDFLLEGGPKEEMIFRGESLVFNLAMFIQELATCTMGGDREKGIAIVSSAVNATNSFAIETVERLKQKGPI